MLNQTILVHIFSDASAYYGTVEKQGCLTLHIHLLVWIWGSFSPLSYILNPLEPLDPEPETFACAAIIVALAQLIFASIKMLLASLLRCQMRPVLGSA